MQVLQALMIDVLDGMPVQSGQPGHMGYRKQLRQRLDPQANTMRNAGPPIKPDDVLGNAGITVMAVQSPDRHIEPDTPVQNVAIAHPAPSALMHQGRRLEACSTHCITLRAGV